jgi:hypothetical protein
MGGIFDWLRQIVGDRSGFSKTRARRNRVTVSGAGSTNFVSMGPKLVAARAKRVLIMAEKATDPVEQLRQLALFEVYLQSGSMAQTCLHHHVRIYWAPNSFGFRARGSMFESVVGVDKSISAARVSASEWSVTYLL